MNALCPDCNTELTPSIMGYLCHGCGNVHSFEKMGNTKVTSGKNTSSKTNTNDKISKTSQKGSQPTNNTIAPLQQPSSPGLKHKVKSFMVPKITQDHEIVELPKPIDDTHLVTQHNTDGIPVSSTASKDNVAPPLATAVSQNEASIDRSNESFAEYLQQEDQDSGQNTSIKPKTNRIPTILAVVALIAVLLLLVLVIINP